MKFLITLLLFASFFSLGSAQCTNRSYDNFLGFQWQPSASITRANFSSAALLVIDMQKDFTFGSFGLPCFNTTPELNEIDQQINMMIQAFSDAGGYVAASKDWHPENHCSFAGEPPCLNNQSNIDQSYQNSFPPHCVHDHQGVPVYLNNSGYRGADFVPDVGNVMLPLVMNKKGLVVYKGFNNSYDSFSAFSMGGSAEETKYTGGYSLNRSPPANITDINQFYPNETEMISPDKFMTPLAQTLRSMNIKTIFVCGLVFDYCVRDTALFGLLPLNMGDIEMFVIADLSRPAMDGTTLKIPVGNHMWLGSPERILSVAGVLVNSGVHIVDSSTLYSALSN